VAPVRRRVAIGLVAHEAGRVGGVLADLEGEAAVLGARAAGVAVDQRGERLELRRPRAELDDDQ
jgi:hypothetical protein